MKPLKTTKEMLQKLMKVTVQYNVLCPVKSIEKYLVVLNPNCDSFWHRPISKEKKTTDAVWNENTPVGKTHW